MKRDDLRQVVIYTDVTRKMEDFRGYFHGWSTDFEEFEAGPGLHPVGIVEEKNSGDVRLVYPTLITFETV